MPNDRITDAITAEAPPAARAGQPRVMALPPSSRVRRQARLLKLRYGLFSLGAIGLAVGGVGYWVTGGRYVETDDAYVEANVLDVSTDVSGPVQQILVREGESVQPGQVLFRLDPTRFQLAVDQAKANLEQTALQLKSLEADYAGAEQQVEAQEARLEADQATYMRDAALVGKGAVTAQQYDDARFAVAAARAALRANEAAAASTLARLGGKADAPVESLPAYKLAAAQLAEAERDYNHSVVRAPFAGVVTRVNKLQPGQYLAAGTAAFGLVETGHVWITAQPKETSLTYARPGDPATVTVDAYPGHLWHGVLESVAPATDQEFAVLPAQNSSGNWVKVVQRVPLRVRIEIGPDDPPLSAGMSAEISIDTHHRRTLADLF